MNPQKIEIIITIWTNQSGQLFEYNSKEFEYQDNFCSMRYEVEIPKKQNKCYYYFFHQPVYYDNKKEIIIERRKECESSFNGQQSRFKMKGYKLIFGIKVWVQIPSGYSVTRKVYITPIEATNIISCNGKKWERNQEEAKELRKPMLVVKSFEKGVQVNLNQTLRFGKSQYKVTEMSNGVDLEQFLLTEEILNLDAFPKFITQTQSQKICKFCLQPTEEGNELITPCKCKGSSAYVHIECLKTWMTTKMTKFKQLDEGNNGSVYYLDKLNCQLCHVKFPKMLKSKGKTHLLLNFMEGERPYIAMQEKTPEVSHVNPYQNLPLFISIPKDGQVTIGRLEENSVHIMENSVSRKHAKIALKNKKFYLEDANSKYGTLVYEKGVKIKLSKNKARVIQVGNMVFGFKVLQPNF